MIWPSANGSTTSQADYAWVVPLLSLLGGLAGGILGGFFAKRGEILAIQGKLDTVVKQNNRLTLEAEEIKRQVSSRQRIWELKRETAYDVMKLCATLNMIFVNVQAGSMHLSDPQIDGGTRLNIRQQLRSIHERFVSKTEELWQLQGLTRLLFDEVIIDGLLQVSRSSTDFMNASQAEGITPNELLTKMAAFERAHQTLAALFQSDLWENSRT
jgi:hypothetical protein